MTEGQAAVQKNFKLCKQSLQGCRIRTKEVAILNCVYQEVAIEFQIFAPVYCLWCF